VLSVVRTLEHKKILIFLIFAFAWSWINWFIGLSYLSDATTETTIGPFVNYFFIGVYGPAIAATATALYFDGTKGLIELFAKLFIWRAPTKIYFFILLFPPVFMASGLALFAYFFGSPGNFDASAVNLIPKILFASLLAGPLGEELGWRGWLLPEIQKRHSAANSSLIIGVIWFLWHAPLFFAPFGTLISGEDFSSLTFVTYLIFVICLSCLYTWLVNSSRGSVLISILIHLSINAGLLLLFFPEAKNAGKLIYLLSTPLIVLVTVYIGFKNGFRSSSSSS
jgi:membrane protease YdiL (CAAX protease family)